SAGTVMTCSAAYDNGDGLAYARQCAALVRQTQDRTAETDNVSLTHPLNAVLFSADSTPCRPDMKQLRERVGWSRIGGNESMSSRRPGDFTEQRLTRRGAVRAGGLGAAALVGGAGLQRVSAQEATPMAGQEAGQLRPLLSDNPMWEAFGNRALVLALDRG